MASGVAVAAVGVPVVGSVQRRDVDLGARTRAVRVGRRTESPVVLDVDGQVTVPVPDEGVGRADPAVDVGQTAADDDRHRPAQPGPRERELLVLPEALRAEEDADRQRPTDEQQRRRDDERLHPDVVERMGRDEQPEREEQGSTDRIEVRMKRKHGAQNTTPPPRHHRISTSFDARSTTRTRPATASACSASCPVRSPTEQATNSTMTTTPAEPHRGSAPASPRSSPSPER